MSNANTILEVLSDETIGSTEMLVEALVTDTTFDASQSEFDAAYEDYLADAAKE